MFAIIIAGGEGQRLRPLTDDRPKSMVDLGGKPILEHQLLWLRENGVTDVVVACGYLHEVIQEHFGEGSAIGLKMRYSIEEEPLGRGGALKLAAGQIPPTERIVVALNGDNVFTHPLGPMLEQHARTSAVGTLLLTQLRSPYGIVRQEGERITAFEEKPLLPHWLSAGMYLLNRGFFDMLPDKGDHEDSLFPQLVEEGRLYAYRSDSYWKAIDTVKDLKEAAAQLEQQQDGQVTP